MSLPLWLLDRHDKSWEQCVSQVVAAPDADTARSVAAQSAYGEGPESWLDEKQSKCGLIATESIYTDPVAVLTKEAS
jgi:hypothetical protein